MLFFFGFGMVFWLRYVFWNRKKELRWIFWEALFHHFVDFQLSSLSMQVWLRCVVRHFLSAEGKLDRASKHLVRKRVLPYCLQHS